MVCTIGKAAVVSWPRLEEECEELSKEFVARSARSRRGFLQAGVIGGAGAALTAAIRPALAGARDLTASGPASAAAMRTAAPTAVPGLKPFELEEVDDRRAAGRDEVREEHLAVDHGNISGANRRLDKKGPPLTRHRIQSGCDVDCGRAGSRSVSRKGRAGRCMAIPVLIKDNIDTADKMMTTAGSLALLGSKAPKDSTVAQQLRDAGAVILGKTNLSEWANYSFESFDERMERARRADEESVCARSESMRIEFRFGRGGVGESCCGGNWDGDGRIDRVSVFDVRDRGDQADGWIGKSRGNHSDFAHAGYGGADVPDLARCGDLAGRADGNGSAPILRRRRASEHSYTDYTQFLKEDGLKGARIGVVRRTFGFSEDVDKVMEAALETMKKQGAILVDPATIESAGKFGESEFTIFLYELKADLNAYLAKLGPNAPVKTLKEIIEFNEKNSAKEMPYFGQDTFLKSDEKGPLTTQEYIDAVAKARDLARKEGIDATMDKNNLDALVGPTGGPAWLTDHINGDSFGGGSSSTAAVAGYPNITVPAGFVHGLPVGISFFGRAWSEPVLLRVAYAFEQATKARKAPGFAPTAKLTQN